MPAAKKHADSAARQRAYRQRQKTMALLGRDLPLQAAIRTMPSHTRWKALEDKARLLLEVVVSEMESYASDRSEEWQESDNATAFEERLDLVREALAAVEAIA